MVQNLAELKFVAGPAQRPGPSTAFVEQVEPGFGGRIDPASQPTRPFDQHELDGHLLDRPGPPDHFGFGQLEFDVLDGRGLGDRHLLTDQP